VLSRTNRTLQSALPTFAPPLCPLPIVHSGGANVGNADGSVRFVRDSTPLVNLQAMYTRAGGETLNVD